MMSRRIARLCLALALVLGAGLLAITLGSAQNFDRNDRAAVLRALRAATGNDVNPDTLCIALPEHFPDLVLVRAMVPDAGCRVEGVFVRGRWERASAGLFERLAREALAARGWARADAEARRTLATQWVVEVAYSEGAVRDPAALDLSVRTASMTAPASEALPNGGVIVRLWVINMTVGGPRPARVTTVIGPEGAPGQ